MLTVARTLTRRLVGSTAGARAPAPRRALSFTSVRQESPFAEGPHVTLSDGNIMPNPAFNVGADLPESKVEKIVYDALQAGFRHLSTPRRPATLNACFTRSRAPRS